MKDVEKHAKAYGNLGLSVGKYQEKLKLTAQKYFAKSQAKILNYLHISETHQIKTDIE
jgi:hypothetical protein